MRTKTTAGLALVAAAFMGCSDTAGPSENGTVTVQFALSSTAPSPSSALGKVELEFPDEEPLVVEEGGDLSVTVFVDPAIWFVNDDGTVDDLRDFDYDTTGEVFGFEAKFEDGFTKIELGDD